MWSLRTALLPHHRTISSDRTARLFFISASASRLEFVAIVLIDIFRTLNEIARFVGILQKRRYDFLTIFN